MNSFLLFSTALGFLDTTPAGGEAVLGALGALLGSAALNPPTNLLEASVAFLSSSVVVGSLTIKLTGSNLRDLFTTCGLVYAFFVPLSAISSTSLVFNLGDLGSSRNSLVYFFESIGLTSGKFISTFVTTPSSTVEDTSSISV